MFLLEKELDDYIIDHIDQEDDILAELRRETNQKIYHPQMLTSHLQGRILEMICHMIAPRRVLEIGTYTGYASICMARALVEDSLLYTIEVNDELKYFAGRYINRAGMSRKIMVLTGDALTIIPGLEEIFDLVYIDGNKKEYPEYYNVVFDKVKPGGFILADNVFWDGKILQEVIEPGDYFTKGILAFNEIVKNDSRVEKVILPVSDGISIIRKK